MKLFDAVSMVEDTFMHFHAAEKKIILLYFYMLLPQY